MALELLATNIFDHSWVYKCPSNEFNSYYEDNSYKSSIILSDTTRENSPVLYQPEITNDTSEEASSNSKLEDKNSFDDDYVNFPVSYYVTSYVFDIPSIMVGKMIGKGGRVIKLIKKISNAQIYVTLHPYKVNYNIVVIEGTEFCIHVALQRIRSIYPIYQYPYITLININEEMMQQSQYSLYYLFLPEQCLINVKVSCVISAGHIFIQQNRHPLFKNLTALQESMKIYYSTQIALPAYIDNCTSHSFANNLIPSPVLSGTLCAAKVDDTWYRSQILEYLEEKDECIVKLLDFGGYQKLSRNELRQIRMDFLSLPVMATECYMSKIIPKQGETVFSIEACSYLQNIITNLDIKSRDYLTTFPHDSISNVDQTSIMVKVDGYALCDRLPFVSLYQCKDTTFNHIENSEPSIYKDVNMELNITTKNVELSLPEQNISQRMSMPAVEDFTFPNKMEMDMISINNLLFEMDLVKWTEDIIF
ncbi:unnamed protein product [Gordionus sp. m RMFG-2023]|uniref:KH domain-containing protein akap-1-like n=1 Tax=Gordionus sp. m RMFG-2023 TaxID=3053472 RepID=UPI0030E3E59E